MTVGAAALDAAEQARRAAELAERASVAALDAQGRVASIAGRRLRRRRRAGGRRTTASATSASGRTGSSPACDNCNGFPLRRPQPAAPQAGRNPRAELARRRQVDAVEGERPARSPRTEPARKTSRRAAGSPGSATPREPRFPRRGRPRSSAGGRCWAGCARRSGGVRQPSVADGEDAGARGLEHAAVAIDEQRQLPRRQARLAACSSSRRSAHLCSPSPPSTTKLRSAIAPLRAREDRRRIDLGGRDARVSSGASSVRRAGHRDAQFPVLEATRRARAPGSRASLGQASP